MYLQSINLVYKLGPFLLVSPWSQDFAGSGAVHLSGAACALAGCVLLGPRLGRFDKAGHMLYISGENYRTKTVLVLQ
jgi:ammonia channel protein AmtB